jgi:type IX secretion system PorP/SprF family membrane protein
MRYLRINIFLFFFTTALIKHEKVFSQDPHFSQYFSSPLTLNPAYTGKFNGAFRLTANQKNQWPTINNAFTTSTISYDFSILNNQIGYYDTWGVGILAVNDKTGNNFIKNNFYSLSTAYSKALDEDGRSQLTLGFQGTMSNKRLDLSGADFADELTADGFTGNTLEVFGSNPANANYFDFNVGLLYALSTNDENSIYVGGSFYHINKPSDSFQGGNSSVKPRMTLHGGTYLPIGSYRSLHASFIYQNQANASEFLGGAALSFNLNHNYESPTELYTGTWFRIGDAIIPYLGIETKGIRLGFSYDINISSLRPASISRGGSEISIIYIAPFKDPFKRKINCPKY